MPRSTADVTSSDPARLLRRLCNHWRHKFDIIHHHDGHALIPLGEAGTAEFYIDKHRLQIQARHVDASQLPRLRDVIANHLERFARDETLSFDWKTHAD